MMMTLAEILKCLEGVVDAHLTEFDQQQPLTQLTIDSRDVVDGSVFIALAGTQAHGITFAKQAIAKGAKLILAEKSPGLVNNMDSLPIIWVDQLAQQCAGLAKRFYQNPSQKLKVIGVTGTNGKTSTAHYTAQLLSASGIKVALLGTLGNGWLNDLVPSQNTTLDVVALNRCLAFFSEQKAEVVVMEVSSHAISLGRIKGIEFEGLALTQVTRDHLDFHQTEAAYQSVKKQLFTDYPHSFQVLNLDDATGADLVDAAGHENSATTKTKTITYAKHNAQADIFASNIHLMAQGMNGALSITKQSLALDVPLMGLFNLENVLCAVGICKGLGLSDAQIEQGLKQLQPVAGRMQCLRHDRAATVVIDYAHTPDALKALLVAIRAHLSQPNQQLWVVFGCGGDRDQGKRPLMGQVAETYADQVVLTDDNPRYESPQAIIEHIKAGMKKPCQVIHDRGSAVATVLTQANPQDIVVLAGKGHESTQEIKGQKTPMQDEALVKQAYAVMDIKRSPS